MAKPRATTRKLGLVETPEQLAALYHDAFSTQAGEAVLEDLEKRYQLTSSFDENPYKAARNEGRREVYLMIRSLLKKHEQSTT